jgi:hypothetical protein
MFNYGPKPQFLLTGAPTVGILYLPLTLRQPSL